MLVSVPVQSEGAPTHHWPEPLQAGPPPPPPAGVGVGPGGHDPQSAGHEEQFSLPPQDPLPQEGRGVGVVIVVQLEVFTPFQMFVAVHPVPPPETVQLSQPDTSAAQLPPTTALG